MEQNVDLSLQLPNELTIYLFHLLEAKDLLSCCKVSKLWLSLGSLNKLWNPLFLNKWLKKEEYVLDAEKSETFKMKNLYLHKLFLENNWRNKDFQIFQFAKKIHNVESFQFSKKYFVTAHWDGSVKIFTRDLTASSEESMELSDASILSKSTQLKQKFFGEVLSTNIILFKEINELHSGLIWWLELLESNVAVTAGDDVIDIEEGKVLHKLANKGAVWGVAADLAQDIVVAGGNHGKLTVWKMSTGEQLSVIKIDRAILDLSLIDNGIVVVGSQFGSIELWSISTKSLVKTITAHKDTIICLKKEKEVMLSASIDNSIILWDIKTFEKKQMINAGGKAWSMALFENKLIAGVLNESAPNSSFLRVFEYPSCSKFYDIDIPTNYSSFRKRISCLHILAESILCCSSNVFIVDFSKKTPQSQMYESISFNSEQDDEKDGEEEKKKNCIIS